MTEIAASMEQYHTASGDHCNFYFAGYHETDEPKTAEAVVSPGRRRRKWSFDYVAFNHMVSEVEEMADWDYSGGADIILANGKPGPPASIDWDSALPMCLDEMKKMGAIVNSDLFFQQIFRYAQNSDAQDPTWGFSDAMAKRIAGSALWGIVLSIVPKTLQAEISKARHFARQGRRKHRGR